jgi:prepilin-type N-terminal cleavage/methylation domain-containing protein
MEILCLRNLNVGMKRNHGFSLLEISIVMVILALLTGGIVAGSSLVRSAEVRSILEDYQVYESALQTFREYYQSLPGDLSNAAELWGAAAGSGSDATCFSAASASLATCNGDGNGSIGNATSAEATSGNHEWFLAWKHLANAGLILGNFTGVRGSAGPAHAVVGQNVPVSKMGSFAGFTLFNVGTPNAGVSWYPGTYNHVMIFGHELGNRETLGPTLSASELHGLDSKIDDALPGQGSVRSYMPAVNGCAVGTNPFTAAYNLISPNIACAPIFVLDF